MQDVNIVSFPAAEVVKEESQDTYTQFKNKVLEAAFKSNDLNAREYKILLVMVRQTYGYHKEEDYISWDQLEELCGIAKRHVSTLVKKLSEKKVLNVSGSGSVRKISINSNVEEWGAVEKLPKTGKSIPENGKDNIPNSGNDLPESGKNIPQTGNKLPNSGKHTKENNKKNINKNLITPCSPPSENSEQEKPKPKAKRARSKPIQIDLSKLPSCISLETAQAFIDHRNAMKRPLTQYAFNLAIKEAMKAPSIGITPDQALDETISAGWQRVKLDWIVNQRSRQANYPTGSYNQNQQQTQTQSNWNEDLGW